MGMTVEQLRKQGIDQAAVAITRLSLERLFGNDLRHTGCSDDEWIDEELEILRREIVALILSLNNKVE
jgi:hypothetical protein